MTKPRSDHAEPPDIPLSLERKIAERVDQELKQCLDHAAEGLHWVGPDGTILWANQTELDLLGYTRDEYVGHNIAEFHVDLPVIEDMLARLARGETLLEYEARLRRKDGTIRYVLVNSNVLWRGDEFLHTRCFTRDVTDRRATDALARRLADIVENSDDAIIGADLEGVIHSWNPAAERMYGYTVAEACGQSIRLIIRDHSSRPGRGTTRRRAPRTKRRADSPVRHRPPPQRRIRDRGRPDGFANSRCCWPDCRRVEDFARHH
jgi:PAS domain S-box-containing protein